MGFLGRSDPAPGGGSARPARRGRAGGGAASDPVAAAVAEVARALAGTGFDDEAARTQLAEALPGDEGPLRAAIDELADERGSGYLEDRAYRLLSAAVDGTPVLGLDPLTRRRFLKERALGRMPLQDGFAHLSLLEPRLRDLLGGEETAFHRAVGPRARTSHEIVKTPLAARIVREFDRASDGGRRPVEDPTPFYERPMHPA